MTPALHKRSCCCYYQFFKSWVLTILGKVKERKWGAPPEQQVLLSSCSTVRCIVVLRKQLERGRTQALHHFLCRYDCPLTPGEQCEEGGNT
jgi:hypothetical protein